MIGGGVVGGAVTHALTRRGVAVVMLEAQAELATGASGTNSGILHTGFDSKMGELETKLILRSAALRDQALSELQVPVMRCGAVVEPKDSGEKETIRAMAEAAERNGVEVSVSDEGALEVPGESVTDPVAYTNALAAAAEAGGAEIRRDTAAEAIEASGDVLRLATAGGSVTAAAVVNCAGLRADEVARMAGDESFEVYPRKGEFFVFDPPGGEQLERILLPVPTERTKGVLVFPTLDGKVTAGPTAIDGTDKDDWSVRPEAWTEVMAKVVRAHPPLEGAEPIASYAGLRPAGRERELRDRPLGRPPRADQRRRDPLDRPLGVARDRGARGRPPRRRRASSSGPSGSSAPIPLTPIASRGGGAPRSDRGGCEMRCLAPNRRVRRRSAAGDS